MASEISLNVTMSCSNGSFRPPAWNESAAFTQSAIEASGGVLNLTTTYATIPLASLATLGYAMVKNIDVTNNLEVGIEVTAALVSVMTLKPGEFALFRFKSGVVPAAKASSGTAKLMYYILND